MLDKQLIDPGYVVKFGFIPTAEPQETGNIGRIRANYIEFQKALASSDHLYFGSIGGFGNTAKDYDISIENHTTGAAVRITSDQPLSKLSFWSAIKTVCPEPYIHIKINPGETFRWKINYHFYTCDITN